MLISSNNKMTEEIALLKENYELGFHLAPELSEEEAQKTVEELSNFITSHEGLIIFAKEPQKFKLAYPINKKLSSYFGFIQFIAPHAAIDQMRNELKLNNKVLRFIVVKQKPKSKKETRIKQPPRLHKIEKPTEKPGEVDKQLEEIIESL